MDWMEIVGVGLAQAVVVGFIALRVLRAAAMSYGQQKGKNLADKEDIAALTKLVEDVKQENALVLEQLRSRQQLRMAAVDKRLQAHQEAFSLWRILIRESTDETVAMCQQWWEKNCLYLSAEARQAFIRACFAVTERKLIMEGLSRSADRLAFAQELKVNREALWGAGEVIVQAVNLPSLHGLERLDALGQQAKEEPDPASTEG